MFLVQSSRTMASAKFKTDTETVRLVDALASRREREDRQRAIEENAKAEARALIAKERAIANQAVSAGNLALAKLHREWSWQDEFGVGPFLSISKIVRRISKATGVSPADICSSKRSKRFMLARFAVFYWCRRRTNKSWPEIGRAIGDRDHTTAIHGTKAYMKRRAEQGRNLPSVF